MEQSTGLPGHKPRRWHICAIIRLFTGMFGFDRVVGQSVACRGARGLVKTGTQELRTSLLLSLPKSLTSR